MNNITYTTAKLSTEYYSLVEKLDRNLTAVHGQDFAVQAVKEYLYGINNKLNAKGVQGLLAFVGSPAVGKTLMGEQIAKALNRPFLRVDMSNYNDKESVFDLFGINPSYKAAGPGYLTSFVDEHPVSVVLLDEFEKAHPIANNRFLQIFENGQVEDIFWKRTVNFRNVIVILTTNCGKALYDTSLVTYNLSQISQPTIINALKSDIDPNTNAPYLSEAIVSRLASGKIILFNKLRPEVLHRIAVSGIEKHIAYLNEQYEITINMDKDWLANLLICNQGEGADVRTILKAIREFFEMHLERMVQIKKDDDSIDYFNVINLKICLENMSETAHDVFFNKDKKRVLVTCTKERKSFFHKLKCENIEFIFADETFDSKTLACLDLSAAIIETGEKSFFAKTIFNAAVEQQEFPVYVFDCNANSEAEFYYYTDKGATGYFYDKQSKTTFDAWINQIIKGIDLSFITQRLFRANKIVTFESSYSFNDDNEANVVIENMDITLSKSATDEKNFVVNRQIPNVRFDDVFGAKEAKQELLSIRDILKNFKRYHRKGIRIPRAMLLDGAPGTGKTMLAKAVASTAEMPFIQINASELKKPLVGEGAKSVRELFAVARKYAPSIVFIDEIDAISLSRNAGSGGNGDHEVLNALLSELDGFQDNLAPVFVIAATNFDARKGSSRLDAALLRRFDRRIHIELPDCEDRKAFLTAELGKQGCAVSESMISSIAKRSVGWSLAELNLVVQNAIRTSISSEKESVTDEILNEAFETYTDGETKHSAENKVLKTAYHEAGHAVVACMLGVVPSYTTITARSTYGGYIYYADEDITEYSQKDILARICIAMAGRASEVTFYGEKGITSGARSDLKSATEYATEMVCEYGMDDFLMHIDHEKRMEIPGVMEKVHSIVKEQYERALSLIQNNKDKVQAVVDALIQKNSLDDLELKTLLKNTQEGEA